MGEATMTGAIASQLEAVRKAVHEIGTEWVGPTADKVLEIYRDLHSRLPELQGQTRVIRDVRYGPAERNVLDVFVPIKPNASPPAVLVYFHGGGFFAGDKAWSEHVYSNIGFYFAKHGFITINANYQLVPHCSYPMAADDVQLVREWVYKNISKSEYGTGSTDKVVLVGQSAGGAHIATNLYQAGDPVRATRSPGSADRAIPPLAGVAYLSAPFSFDHTKARRAQTLREYYGSDDPQVWEPVSPLGLLKKMPPGNATLDAKLCPTLITVGEFDSQEIVDANVLFFNAYRERSSPKGILPLFNVVPDHNHISNVLSIGTEDDVQGRMLREFVKRCCS